MQPYSGSPANLAVYLAFCQPGDPSWASALPARRSPHARLERQHHRQVLQERRLRREPERPPHRLRRGAAARQGAQAQDHLVRHHRLPARARLRRSSAKSPTRSGAKLCADIAHIAGLVAGGAHPSPVGIADVVTSTTHKTLRGPRGGMIMCKAEHAKDIDRAVFPGLQGGPHNHTTAGIAVAAKEASDARVQAATRSTSSRNAKALAEALLAQGLRARHRRHRQPPDPDRSDAARTSPGKVAAQGARSRRHRRQLQLDPVRSAQALRSVGHPHRHALDHLARHGQRRNEAARGLDGPRSCARRTTKPCSSASPPRCGSSAAASRRPGSRCADG